VSRALPWAWAPGFFLYFLELLLHPGTRW
jgi:hypothetical protein